MKFLVSFDIVQKNNDKGKLGESQGRKATGPRFLRDVRPKDPKIAGLPQKKIKTQVALALCSAG